MELVHALVVGNGEKDLIVLHGFLGMGDNWKTHAKNWASQGWRVHLIDQRNHGVVFGLLISAMRKWQKIYAIISIKNQLEQATILGYSMGRESRHALCLFVSRESEQLIVADIAPQTYPPHHQTI